MAVNLFDANYYRAANPDLAGFDDAGALAHFQTFGLDEGRVFSPLVNLDLYRFLNPDLAGFNNKKLFEHLQNFGIAEGRRFSVVFDVNFYRNANPDFAAAGLNNTQLLEHFQSFGLNEGRASSEFFNVSEYLANNPDLAAYGLNNQQALQHFIQFAIAEGRNPSGLFENNFYLARNPDIAAAVSRKDISSGLVHFVAFGQAEGQTAVNKGFNIQFDYRFDTNGFFAAPAKRAVLEAAADIWETLIQDDFRNVPAGTKVTVFNPQTGQLEEVALTSDIDDILIFVGAKSPPFNITDNLGNSAKGGPGIFGTNAGSVWEPRNNSSNFEPWGGAISFDPSVSWFFDPTPNTSDDIPKEKTDFISIATHEIGHVLGIGTSDIFKKIGAGASFNGPNASAVNGGFPIPLQSDLGHVRDNFTLSDGRNVLMGHLNPSDRRLTPSRLDLALLADIGYEISGFQSQGSTPPIATEGDDSIFGTIRPDISYGLDGNDLLVGNDANDWLYGGAGNDALFGEAGNDILIGEAGSDRLQGADGDDLLKGGAGDDDLFGEAGRDRFVFGAASGKDIIHDFAVAEDTIQISAEVGFGSVADIFGAIATSVSPTTGVLSSVVTLNPGNAIEIFHDLPLTEANFSLL